MYLYTYFYEKKDMNTYITLTLSPFMTPREGDGRYLHAELVKTGNKFVSECIIL
jgi:hypothetical protein